MKKMRIGAGQAFALLLLSRVFTLVVWVYQSDMEMDGNYLIWGELIGFLFQLVLLLPAYFFLRKKSDATVIGLAVRANKPLGKLFAVCCILTTFGFGLLTFTSFLYFLINTAFSNQAVFQMFLVVSIVVIYGVCCGLEPLARTGTIIFFICAASLAFTMLTMVPHIQLAELHPVGQRQEILQIAVEHFGSGGELLCILLLSHQMQGKKKRWMGAFLTVSFLVILILDFLTITVMGDYAKINRYPLHALFGMARFSIFQHLEAFHITVWIFMGCVKTVLYLVLMLLSVRELFPARPLRYLTPAALAVFLAVALPLCYHLGWIWRLQQVLYSGVPLLITVWLFPLILLPFQVWKERKP